MYSDCGMNTFAADYCDNISMLLTPAAVAVLREALAKHAVESVTPNSFFCPGCHTSVMRDREQSVPCITLAAAVEAGWQWPTPDDMAEERARWKAAHGLEATP